MMNTLLPHPIRWTFRCALSLAAGAMGRDSCNLAAQARHGRCNVTVLCKQPPRRRSWAVGCAAGALAAAAILGAAGVALTQDQSAATPKDVIFARKTLMNS